MDLLFAEGSQKNTRRLKAETIKDLALSEVIESMAGDKNALTVIKKIFTEIPLDIEDIRFRQDIMRDLVENSELSEGLSEIIFMIQTLKDYDSRTSLVSGGETSLYTLLENLREISAYVNVSEALSKILAEYPVRSKGLNELKDKISGIVGDEGFAETKQDIDNMLEELSTVKGAIVGVNFTPDLNVESVAAIEFVPYRLRSKYKFAEIAAAIGNVISFGTASNSIRGPVSNVHVVDPLLVNMTPAMEKHLKTHYFRIKSCMKKYLDIDSTFITEMYEALTFYTSAARFIQRLRQKGYELCFPDLSEDKDGFYISDLYNIRLALTGEENIIKNDFSFTKEENLFILTGPNRGGKTILEQALGIISVMASCGLCVTASKCTGRPFDNILTHFPIDENLTINYGRLGEEAVRIKELVKEADDKTLLLFNETYSTTSSSDGLYLSKDLLHILKEKGAAVIFNTHIHEVARDIGEMNTWEGESRFVSLVMEIKNGENTFKVKRSEPDTRSYAEKIAEKYGITYDQMKHM